MKTKGNKGKQINEQLRDIRDNLNASIKDMTHDQLKEYLMQQKTLHPAKAWRKRVASAK